MPKSMGNKFKRNQRSNSLYGQPPPGPEVAARGMRQLEKQLAGEFAFQTRERAKLAGSVREAFRPLERIALQDPAAAKGIRALRELSKNRPKRLPAPATEAIAPKTFSGSIGALYGPPFDVRWTWSAKDGSPILEDNADENAASIELFVGADGNDASAGSVRGAVGNFLSPPMTGVSTMQVSAAPNLHFFWDTYTTLSSCWSAGWIGFSIASFDRAGNFIDTVVNQQNPIWDHQASGISGTSDSQTITGFPLQAQFNAIEGMWYIVWVWAGCYAYGNGWDAVSGSGAGAFMSITVPWFSWRNG